jgi:hypothetical protein
MATAKRKRRSSTDDGAAFIDDLSATRAVWSEHMAVIAPNAAALAADVGRMLVDLSHSPLGVRARRNPEISFAVAAVSLGLLARLLRLR